MKLAVCGATGGVGGHLVRQALAEGHAVTALVRNAARLDVPHHAALEVAEVPDLAEPDVLAPLLQGHRAVLSGLGPRHRTGEPVAAPVTRGILQAMHRCGLLRLVVVSAAPVGATPEGESLTNRWVLLPTIRRLLRDLYADLADMETAIADSSTEWTIVRPPKLVNTALTGTYRTVLGGTVPRGYRISRADTAHAMLAALNNPATLHHTMGVAY